MCLFYAEPTASVGSANPWAEPTYRQRVVVHLEGMTVISQFVPSVSLLAVQQVALEGPPQEVPCHQAGSCCSRVK